MNEPLDYFSESKPQINRPITGGEAFRFGSVVWLISVFGSPILIYIFMILMGEFNVYSSKGFPFLLILAGGILSIPNWLIFSFIISVIGDMDIDHVTRKIYINLVALIMTVLLFVIIFREELFYLDGRPLLLIIVVCYVLTLSGGIWLIPLGRGAAQAS